MNLTRASVVLYLDRHRLCTLATDLKLALFYDVLHAKCSASAVPIEVMSYAYISDKWETAMTSQGHVTTASLKQSHKEDNREAFFIRLHLKKFCASILETSHSKL